MMSRKKPSPVLLSPTGRVKTLAFRRRLSARARRINFGDGGIPAGRAHCIRNPLASGVDHEVSETSATGRDCNASAGPDPGHLRPARGIDHERPRVERPRASTNLAAAASYDQPSHAMAEGPDGASPAGRVSAPEEAVLGTTSVGTRLLLLQLRQRDGRRNRKVHRRAKC